jgi:hypothetical protein
METDSHSKGSEEVAEPTLNTRCIYVSSPFPECYFMNMNSYKIFKILKYCIGDFRSCEIYCNKGNDKNN